MSFFHRPGVRLLAFVFVAVWTLLYAEVPAPRSNDTYDALIQDVLAQDGQPPDVRQVEQVLRDWASTSFVREIRARDPLGSLLFLKLCLELEVDPVLLEDWVRMMPESVGVEYELLRRQDRTDGWVQAFNRRKGDLRHTLSAVLRPEYREWIPEGLWSELAEAMAASKRPSGYFLSAFDSDEPPPPVFLEALEDKLFSSLRSPSLFGIYLMSYRVPGREGEELRSVCASLIRTAGDAGDWMPALDRLDPTPTQAFWLAVARASSYQPYEDDVFPHLADIAAGMGDDVLLKKVLEHSTQLNLMRRFIDERPEWIQPIGMAMLDELEREFTGERLWRIGRALGGHGEFLPPIGRLDDPWLALLRSETEGRKWIIGYAVDIGVSPNLIWEALLEFRRELGVKDASHYHDLKGGLLHIIEHGEPDLAGRVVAYLRHGDEAGGRRFPDSDSILKEVIKRFPEFVPDRFSIQLDSFHSYPDFLHQHKGEILRRLKTGGRIERLHPLLYPMARETEFREGHRDLLRKTILQASALEGLTAPQRFRIALAGLWVGLENKTLDRDIHAYYMNEEINPDQAWRTYFLLDETHARLLPGLLKACDLGASPGVALMAALMVAPSHPEVEKRVHDALFRGDDRALAFSLADRLRLFDRAPPLDAYPKGRLEWLLDVDTREDYHALRSFLYAYGRDDHQRLLPLVLPRLEDYAALDPYYPLDILFRDHPENQREASGPMMRMLNSVHEAHTHYAAQTLASFDTLTRKELEFLGRSLGRFKNELNLNPRLLRAVSNMGSDASFLEKDVARLTREGRKNNFDDARACLANIASDERTRFNSLEILIRQYEEAAREKSYDQDNLLRLISHVRDREERIVPLLHSVLDDYTTFSPDRPASTRSARQAVWGLVRQRADDALFDTYRDLLRQTEKNDRAAELSEAVLWCLANEYGDRLPEIHEELAALPTPTRATHVFRKIREKLRREGVTLEMMP